MNSRRPVVIVGVLLTVCLLSVVPANAQGTGPQSTTLPLIDVLRDAKTVKIVGESTTDDKTGPLSNGAMCAGSLAYLFRVAGIERVSTPSDLVFVIRCEYDPVYGYYGSAASPMKLPTGGSIEGTLRIEFRGAQIHTIRFKGSESAAARAVLSGPGGINPFFAALGHSTLYGELLSALFVARGAGASQIAQRIFKDLRWVDGGPGWDGALVTYWALFPTLAASAEPWATEMLLGFSEDKESPTARALAVAAIERRRSGVR